MEIKKGHKYHTRNNTGGVFIVRVLSIASEKIEAKVVSKGWEEVGILHCSPDELKPIKKSY